MNKQKIIIDSFLSIIASAIPIVILQLIVLPFVALELGEVEYGLVVTLVSMATMFSLPFGNVLNNIRLLLNNEYQENNLSGDFNVLLLVGSMLNTICMVIGTIYYVGHFSWINIMLVIIFSTLNLLREYFIVSFRITINYKLILINNVFLGTGYLLGLILFAYFDFWQLIYISGAGLSLIYIIKKTKLLNEGLAITKKFKRTAYKSVILFVSSFIKSALTQADKLLLFPLLGPVSVSIYYSATLIGKIISMAITPISGVMLSYLSKMKNIKMKDFFQMLLIVSIFGMIGYFLILLLSSPILTLLYPQWADQSLKFVPVTAAATIINAIAAIIHPIILRFNHINWQLFINGTSLIVYIACVFFFYNLYGLLGFCVGVLIANLIKVVIMICIFIFGYYTNDNRKIKEVKQ